MHRVVSMAAKCRRNTVFGSGHANNVHCNIFMTQKVLPETPAPGRNAPLSLKRDIRAVPRQKIIATTKPRSSFFEIQFVLLTS